MANNYYNFPVPFIAGTKVRSDQVNTQYSGIEAGFDLLSTDPAASIIGTTFFGTDVQGATVNEYLITTPDPNTPLVNGQRVSFFATHSNNGAVTLNVDGSGLVAGVNLDGDAVVDGQIVSGQFYEWVYDNANTQWLVTKGISGITDPLLLSNGTVGAPTYSFELDPDTGMFQNGANILGLAAGGFLPVQVDASNGAGNLQFIVSPGGPQATATFPSLAFGDGDTGFHEPSDDQIAVSLAGVNKFFWAGDVYGSLTGAGPAMLNEAASSTNPTLVPNRGDLNTGLGRNAANEPSLIGNGVELARGVAALSGGLLVNNLLTGAGIERVLTTGDAGGVVGDVFKVGTPVNNQVGVWTGDGTIEGTAGLTYDGIAFNVTGNITLSGTVDGIDIATDVAANTAKVTNATHTGDVTGSGALTIANDAVTYAKMQNVVADDRILGNIAGIGGIVAELTGLEVNTILPNFTSALDGLAPLSGGGTVNFLRADGTWATPPGIGGGDVTKVGTPVDNQIGVWTGDGTIEGDANLVWSGTILTVGGTIRVANAGGGAILNEQVTLTNPSIITDVGDVDTGFGSGGTNSIAVIVGAQTYAQWRATGAGDGSLEATYDLTTGLAASVTQTQGQNTQNSAEYSELTTVANPDDVITLGAVAAGRKTTVVNSGANQLQIFPTVGDNLGDGVDASMTLPVGESVTFLGLDAINWQRIAGKGSTTVGTGDVTKVGTPVNNQIGIWTGDGTIEGVTAVTWDGTDFDLVGNLLIGTTNDNPALLNVTGSVTVPTVIPLKGDLDTGLGADGADSLAAIAGGLTGQRWDEQNAGVLIAYSSSPTLTAFATGGQGGATVLINSYNVITTVATTGDSVRLQTNHFAGTVVYIKNDGANACDVFPAAGDNLGAGIDTAVSLGAGQSMSFISTVTLSTWTQLIVDTSGTGNVIKVGTPVDNQIGVWTGDGTIEGDANFTWDGSQLSLPSGTSAGAPELKIGPGQTGLFSGAAAQLRVTVDGTERFTFTNDTLQGFLAGSGRMVNRVSSLTVPTFVPNTNDDNTGIGSDGTDILALIAGGVQIAQAKEVVGANQFIVAPGVIQNVPATPSLALGDGDTGFYEEVDDTIAVALSGNKEFEFAPVGDPQFADVELLTNLDGTDGQTTFTEQSTNAAVATFVSTAELDTAQFKFGTASLLLDGVSDYIHFPDNVAYALGSGDFVIEGWVRFASLPAVGDEMTFISQWSNTTGTDQSFAISLIQDGLSYRIRGEFEDAVGVFEQGNVGGAPALNTWFHWAAQRQSSDETLSLWWNGNSEFSASGIFSGSMQNSTETLKLGVRDPAGGANAAWVDGWIDDVRITVGSTRYTPGVSLTIPTAAFPTNSGEFTGAAVGAGKLFNTIASLTSPTLVPRNDDDDTGIGGDGTDALAIIAGGVEGMRFTELNDGVISAPAASLAVTAFATGGQGSATQLDNGSNVLATVATTGDSVKLPPVFAANAVVYIKNDGANAADVFPATGDNLGAGLNTAVSIPAGSSISFIATVANATWTQWIVDTFGAGDVVKVGTPVNNQVGVWTGDGTIEGDTNFQFNGSQLLLLDGTAAAPSYSWVSDPDTGVYRFSTNRLGFAAGGAAIAVMNSSEFSGVVAGGPALRLNAAASSTVPVLIPNVTTDSDTGIGWNAADQLSLVAGGVEMARFVEAVGIEQTLILNNDNTGLPDLAALGDPDTGWSWDTLNGMYWNGGGSRSWNFTTAQFFSQFSNGAAVINAAAASGQVVFRPDRSDADTGIGTDSADGLQLISGGVVGLTLKEANAGVIQVPQANVAVTAFATGGQVSATQLDESYSVIGTVVTTGDSVKLPLTFLINSIMFIKNDGANAADVFPGVGDDLGAGLNTAVSLAAGESASFIATVANSTWTPWIVDTAGTGDVTKVGTPANNQVGVWTGDGTIEGDTGFQWNGTDVNNNVAGGAFRGSQVRAGAIVNETGSATNPTIIPNVDDLDTGLGAAAADQFSLIAGGVEMLRATEAGTSATDQIFLPRDGAAATPALALGATNHGFFTGGTAQINAAVSGVTRFFVNSSAFTGAGVSIGVDLATGPRMLNEVASATNPTVIPQQGDGDTGLGWNAAGQPSLIGNGVELARGVAAASGGLQANNADTGGGLERVLTESDLALPEFQFFADQFENPVNADWTVNALAPAAADSNNNGLTVRLFDDTAEEGVGFIVEVPAGATNIVFDFVSRAETAPGVVNTVGLDIYNRGIPNNAAVQAWSVSTALTDISIPTNEFVQEDTQTVTLATLGVTAGETTQFELVRTLPGAGTDLTGDWALLLAKVSFT